MKTTIVLHDVYCDVTYPEYLHFRNRYYKNPSGVWQNPYVLLVFKEYLKLLNRLYDITWLGQFTLFINRFASITCSTISNIPYNLIFTTKFNDSSILITIISCDYLNLSLADEHVGDVTIPTQVIEYNQSFLQAD